MNYDFLIQVTDTDSISVCKADMSSFSELERKNLLKELNEISPEFMVWDDDGHYKTVIPLKAKNYILQTFENKVTIKGSALKATTKCVALKEFIKEMINALLEGREQLELVAIYNRYAHEIMNIQDIKRWTARKTISEKIFSSERANETKVKDVIEDTEYVEGDRVRVFYMPDDSLELEENFNGTYNRKRLFKNLYNTVEVFKTIIAVKELFTNYSLVKNYKTMLILYELEE